MHVFCFVFSLLLHGTIYIYTTVSTHLQCAVNLAHMSFLTITACVYCVNNNTLSTLHNMCQQHYPSVILT